METSMAGANRSSRATLANCKRFLAGPVMVEASKTANTRIVFIGRLDRLALNDTRRAAHGDRTWRNGPRYHGSRTHGGVCSDIRHHNGRGADPAIAANRNRDKLTFVRSGNLAGAVAHMLMTATKDLDTRSNLAAWTDRDPSQNTVRADIHPRTNGGFAVREE